MRESRKTLALLALCSGALIVVLDTTIVAVALPSILADLGISEGSLSWLVNAYLVPFAGCLILGGRLGDVYGPRRMFVSGVLLFLLGSLICGLAPVREVLLAGRAVQGLAGALVMAICLVLLMRVFPGTAERAQALSIYGLVCSAGGAVGELLGGVLTQTLNWHWIFLVNVPLGLAVSFLCLKVVPEDSVAEINLPHVDFAGAVTITAAIGALIYALSSSTGSPGSGIEGAWSYGLALAALTLFVVVERSAREPLIPLGLFRLRNFAAANVLGVFWAMGSSAWLVVMALYLQRILHYDPLQVGLAFLPAQVVMAIVSVAGSARIITRFGIRDPLWMGLLLVSAGLLLFARAPLHGSFWADVLPGTLLLGLGGGIASTPLLMAAMQGVERGHVGVASGVVNTAFMTGSALGLTVLVTLAQMRAGQLKAGGSEATLALNGGYHLAFAVAAAFAATGAALALLTLRSSQTAEGKPAVAPYSTG